MERKKRKLLWVLAACAAAALLAFPVIGHIPIARACPALKAPEEIGQIYLEVDGLEAPWLEDGGFLTIADPAEIETICGYLEGVHLVYMGPNRGIPYGAQAGDYTVVLRLGRNSPIFLKGNGDLYNGSTRYLAKGTGVPALYRYLLERYCGLSA